jgi:hypothetical protein
MQTMMNQTIWGLNAGWWFFLLVLIVLAVILGRRFSRKNT